MEKQVVIIDDDEAILEVIKIILEDKGYDVKTVLQSTQAEKEILFSLPDIIFVDYWMTGLNGKHLITLLKKNPKTKDIPIIMISANHEVEQIAKEVQADGFLAKPFDIEDLIEIVKKYTQ